MVIGSPLRSTVAYSHTPGEQPTDVELPFTPRLIRYLWSRPPPPRVYLINCMVAVLNGLSSRRSVASRAQQLSDLVEGHLTALVSGEVGDRPDWAD